MNAAFIRIGLSACDIGVRKKPSEERGPKPNSPTRQPQTIITSGVRQPTDRIARTTVSCAVMNIPEVVRHALPAGEGPAEQAT
jgi:hypothetical protein